MKIVVFGGTGLIGSKLVSKLREMGHAAVAASPETGVNVHTGEGLRAALKGARVVIDVMNVPPFEENSVSEFFQLPTRGILAEGKAAGVRHHVALSIVGTDRLLESAYFCAKLAQESLIRESGIPYTILRSTQLFEFIGRIGIASPDGRSVRSAPALVQPIGSDDVVAALADIAGEPAASGIVEIAGPERFRLDDLLRHLKKATGDVREVITDRRARYFGALLDDQMLTPDAPAKLGTVCFADWLAYYIGHAPMQKPATELTTRARRDLGTKTAAHAGRRRRGAATGLALSMT